MKKILTIILSFICIATSIPVLAECENVPITDSAEYLTQAQKDELSEKIENLRKTYHFDVAVYTENEMPGEDAEERADDIYDYYHYGDGENADGILLYIAKEPRVYQLTTHGSGETVFNKNGLAYLEQQILPALQEDDYDTAIRMYIETSEELLKMAAEGEPFNESQHSTGYVCGVIAGAILLPLLLAYLLMRMKLSKMKTAVENDYAANYMKPGSMHLTFSRDIFLYSNVTKTKREKSDSDGHISSSGEHHGGRGGSY